MEENEILRIKDSYGFSDELIGKLSHSIDLIRKSESIALRFSEKGFYLAFSGGKDSQCLYHVAKLAGVKFEPNMNMTTVDPPELVMFVKRNYPDVVRNIPDINFWDLMVKKKSLPSRRNRFCCQYLKERGGAGTVSLIGIRSEESIKRSRRKEIETTRKRRQYTLDQFDEHKEQIISCVGGKDRLLISPILDWTEKDVWEFLEKLGVPHCSLYDRGHSRIGCIYCPMAKVSEMQQFEKEFKHQTKKFKDCIKKLTDMGKYSRLNGDVDLIFEWYKSKLTMDDFLKNRERNRILNEIVSSLIDAGVERLSVSEFKEVVELPEIYKNHAMLLRSLVRFGLVKKEGDELILCCKQNGKES